MKNELLRELPSVDELTRDEGLKEAASLHSAALVTEAARAALREVRAGITSGKRSAFSKDELIALTLSRIASMTGPSVKKIINASGTVIHTNIGRAVLSKDAVDAIVFAASNNTNLEFDLVSGERGDRDSLVEEKLKRLTGAEAATVVNNNAAAVLLTLNTLAEGKEVIISRGELIEIGGSFRLPEIIKKSGCVLKEVGTTNRTHPGDYSKAINNNTALILKAHTSNYRVVGFTAEVGLKELAEIGKEYGVPVVEDLGSGSLVDLSEYGVPKEPIVADSVANGADIVTFSGDKLLGGPQAGIAVGKKALVEKLKKNHLKRALRADKLTLSALEATLRLYLNRDTLVERLPTLRHLSRPLSEIEDTAVKAVRLLEAALGKGYVIMIEDGESVAGGGSLPGQGLPTKVISITHIELGPHEIFRNFLNNDPAILGRVNRDRFLLDMRTVDDPSSVVPSGC
ncbi:MAG: L-seryl-tRNA(Sec) selenium transferase [Deltaproteobacteria bacterium]|nr:L-seryl-tRNA(Sec) selenium transferase [Deltaproteobacteria bacterium]